MLLPVYCAPLYSLFLRFKKSYERTVPPCKAMVAWLNES